MAGYRQREGLYLTSNAAEKSAPLLRYSDEEGIDVWVERRSNESSGVGVRRR